MIDQRRATAATLTEEMIVDQPASDPLSFAVASRDRDVMDLVRDGLAAGRAQLAFQPILMAQNQSFVAFYEGLIRVTDDGGRVIPASHFMPLIEENALGREIDAVTLDLAFRMLRNNPAIRLSINLSARSLGDGEWRRVLDKGLAERGSLGDRLIFEISETSAMYLHEVVARFMTEMQPRGVAFALDGFGAGMTAFRFLKDFMFDLVKIDKSFVRGVARDPDHQVLIEALVSVAHQFEMFAVADGVENAEDAAWLAGIGVDCLQGYLFGVPKFSLDVARQ